VTRYITRRLIQIPITIWYVVTLAFIATRLTGDPVGLMLPPGSTLQAIATFRKALGLNQSIAVQYAKFLEHAATGDFGQSIYYRVGALHLVLQRLPATLELAGAALLVAVIVGVLAGLASALRRGWLDDVSSLVVVLAQSIPTFWLGMILIIIFAVDLRVFPVLGRGSFSQLVLPALTLAAYPTALIARMTRSSVLDVSREDYVRTARAKGLSESAVTARHILPNAALPIVTVVGLQTSILFSGAVVTETVFAWPGLGSLITSAIVERDYPIVVAGVLVIAVIFMVVALVVDLLYLFINPLVRYRR
jgi:peptide/nickel transport system permease protein